MTDRRWDDVGGRDRADGDTRRLVYSINFVDALGLGIVQPILPFLIGRQDNAGVLIAAVVAVFALAELAASPLLGRMSDHYGRARVLFVSGCGSVASFLMMLVTTTMPGLLAARALGGVAAAGETVAQALLTDGVSASDHPSAIATLGAVRGAGTLFGPLLGALVAFTLPSNPFGGAIVLSVVLACIPLLMTAAYMRRHPHQPSVVKLSGAPDRDQAAPPTVRTRVWTAIGLTGFIAVPTALLITVAPIFIQRVYGAGPGETGLLLSSGVVAVILSRLLLLPVLVRRLGVWARLATTAVLTALGAAAAPYQSSLVAFGVAMSVLAVGASGALTFTSAFVAEVAPVARRGEFLGWNAAAYSLMIVVSALAGGVLFDRLGPGAPFLIGVGSAVAATVLAVASGVLSCPRH